MLPNLFKKLYAQRLPVEKDYKKLKSKLQVENWSGKTLRSSIKTFMQKLKLRTWPVYWLTKHNKRF